MSIPPPYSNIAGISRADMKDNRQETFANYDGNARPGELVVDLSTYTVYVGHADGSLTAVGGGGSTTWTTLGDKNNTSGPTEIALGQDAGDSQGTYAIAIGVQAGNSAQAIGGVAIGPLAGQASQGAGAVAVGGAAGQNSQAAEAVAVGQSAGSAGQGAAAIAIGASISTVNPQDAHSIVMNATGSLIDSVGTGTFVVQPVRGDSAATLTGSGFKAVYYNPVTGEFAYASGP